LATDRKAAGRLAGEPFALPHAGVETAPMQKQILFVLGVSRSGTSALTRVLSLCGAGLPKTLLPPNRGNPTGYWEPLDGLELNDEILSGHGSAWHDPTLRLQYDENVFTDTDRAQYIERIRAFLDTSLTGTVNVIKEPRITGLLDFWLPAALSAGFTVKFVISVRHPGEVAASLAARDRASIELSSVLWLKYNMLAERASNGFPRVFVEYANLLNDWRAEIKRISAALAIDLNVESNAEIEKFLSRDLRRQMSSGEPIEVFGTPWLTTIYQAYSEAARDIPLDHNVIDPVFQAFTACERTYRLALRQFDTRFTLGSLRDPLDLMGPDDVDPADDWLY
jgi:hypothetical protein